MNTSTSYSILRVLVIIAGVLSLVFFWDLEIKGRLSFGGNKTVNNTTGLALKIPAGFGISIFAKGLDAPGAMTLDDKGNILVVSKGKIIALRDNNKDGILDKKVVVVDNLDNPEKVAIRCNYELPSQYLGETTPESVGLGLKTSLCKLYVQDQNELLAYDYSGQKILAINRRILSESSDDALFVNEAFANEAGSCSGVAESSEPTLAVFCAEPSATYQSIAKEKLFPGIAVVPAYGWPQAYSNNILVAYAGEENKGKPVGYKIVRYKFDEDMKYVGEEDFISGFRTRSGRVIGRPTGLLTYTPSGRYISDLFISDSYNGNIYRVSYRGTTLTA